MKEAEELIRYSDHDLEIFKQIIKDKLRNAKRDANIYRGLDINENSGDEMGKSNKPFEDTSADASKQQNGEIALRIEKLVRDLENALVRIRNKTYGICRVTKNLINPERLKLVPHATLSIEAKNSRV